MKIFAQKARVFSATAFLLALVFTLGLTISGCGSSDDTPEAVKYANLIVKHNLVYSRSLSTDVKKIILSGYDEKGQPTFDSAVYERTTTITKSAPVTTTSIRLSYLDENDALEGLYVQKVILESGTDYVINDPEWQSADSQSFVKSVVIDPTSLQLELNEYFQFSLVGNFSANGSSFTQQLTREAVWTVTGNVPAIKNLGEGSIKAASSGTNTLTADYAGVTADATVTVLGGESDLALHPRHVYVNDGKCVVPISVDEPSLVKPEYDTNVPFTPLTIVVEGKSDPASKSEDLEMKISNPEIFTAEIKAEVWDGGPSETVVVIHPQNIGTATLTVTRQDSYPDGSIKVHRAQLDIEVVNLPLKGFYINPEEMPEKVDLAAGLEFIPRIWAVFTEPNARQVMVEVSSTIPNDLDTWDLNKDPRFPADFAHQPRYYYNADHEKMITFRMLFPFRSDTNVDGVTTATFTTPTGYEFFKEPTCDTALGTEFTVTFTDLPAVPRNLVLYNAERDMPQDLTYPIGIKLTPGETDLLIIKVAYTDDHSDFVTEECKYEFINNGVITYDEHAPWRITALKRGLALVTVSLGETVPEATFSIVVK